MEDLRPVIPGVGHETLLQKFEETGPVIAIELTGKRWFPSIHRKIRRYGLGKLLEECLEELRLKTANGHPPPTFAGVEVVKRCPPVQKVAPSIGASHDRRVRIEAMG